MIDNRVIFNQHLNSQRDMENQSFFALYDCYRVTKRKSVQTIYGKTTTKIKERELNLQRFMSI